MKKILQFFENKFEDKFSIILIVGSTILAILAFRNFIITDIVSELSFGKLWLGYLLCLLCSLMIGVIEMGVILVLFGLIQYYIIEVINVIKRKDFLEIIFELFGGIVFVFFFHYLILLFITFFLFINFQIVVDIIPYK